MSLGVVVKGPEGVVLASDSRVTLQAQRAGAPIPISVNFDNATKLLSLQSPHDHVGAVTYGAAVIGQRTAQSFIPELDVELEEEQRLDVADYAERLQIFFTAQWADAMPEDYDGPSMTFLVAGYDRTGPYGRVFQFEIPGEADPFEQNAGDTNFGMTWGGQIQIGSRLIHGFDPVLPGILQQELNLTDEQVQQVLNVLRQNLEFVIPFQVLPLQDCVDLATYMVRATMVAQDLGIGVRGVGGEIEVAVVTRTDGLSYLNKKSLNVGTSQV